MLPPASILLGVTLSYLMQTIWFVTPEMIAGAPKWLDTDRWGHHSEDCPPRPGPHRELTSIP